MSRFPEGIINIGPPAYPDALPVPPLTIDDIVVKVAPEIGIPLKDFPLTRLSGPFIENYLTCQEADEANTQTGPLRPSGKLFGVAVVLGFGVSAAMLAACSPAQAQQAAEVRQAEQTAQALPFKATISSVSKDVAQVENTPTPLSTATSTPKPPETPTLMPTPKDTATAVSTATTKSTATATSTLTPEPTTTPEKLPLPEYELFKGNLIKKDTKENVGRVELSYLPNGKLFIYYLYRQGAGAGGQSLLLTLQPQGDGSYKTVEKTFGNFIFTLITPNEVKCTFKGNIGELEFIAASTGEKGKDAIIKEYADLKRDVMRLGDASAFPEWQYQAIRQSIIDELAKAKIILP